jgi:hypothetical protein
MISMQSYNLLNGKIGMKRVLGQHFDLDVYFGNEYAGTKYYMVFVNQPRMLIYRL